MHNRVESSHDNPLYLRLLDADSPSDHRSDFVDHDILEMGQTSSLLSSQPLGSLQRASAEPMLAAKHAAQQRCQVLENETCRGRLMFMADAPRELEHIPARLAELARAAGLRFVCLDHPDSLDDLLTKVASTPNGWRQYPGPLREVLENGGWLYIHYEQFVTAEAESLNDLFAAQPTFRGRPVHPNLQIFGAMLRGSMRNEDHSEAFVSRYGAWRSHEILGATSYVDPLDSLPTIRPEELAQSDAPVIHLFKGGDFHARLCARPQSGATPVAPGTLRAALRHHNTVILRNAPWQELGFCMFMRSLLHGEVSDLEGPLRLGPQQRIIRCDGYTEAEETRAVGLFAPSAVYKQHSHVLTTRNFGQLVRTIDIIDGDVREAAGVLARLPAHIPLRVAGKLLPHQWEELGYGTIDRRVLVDPGVALPNWLQHSWPTQSSAPVAKPVSCSAATLAAVAPGTSCVIACDDQDAAVSALSLWSPGAEIFDASEDTEAGDLLFAVRRHERRFHLTTAEFWRQMQDGKTIILRNLGCNANLAADLLPLLVSERPVLWCEGEPSLMRGRLLVIEAHGSTVASRQRLRFESSDETILASLRHRYPWVDARWVDVSSRFISEVGALAHRRKALSGGTPSRLALLSKVARLQHAMQHLPTYDAKVHAKALAAALMGPLAFDPQATAAAKAWFNEHLTDLDSLAVACLNHPLSHAGWEQKLDATADILRLSAGVFLQGPPGAGKTYCAQALAKRLNAEVFGPLSVGEDTNVEDVIGQVRVVDGSTRWEPGCIDHWARALGPQIKLLVVDEANLVPEHFWNFLNGLFDATPSLLINGERVALGPQHRVLFTGNQDTFAGRTIPQPIKSHFVTIPFQSFETEFLLNECLLPTLARLVPQLDAERCALIRSTCAVVLDKLRQVDASALISPRNIEEATVRLVMRLREDAPQDVAAITAHSLLDVQVGSLPAAQVNVLRTWALMQFGAAEALAPEAWLHGAAHSARRLVLTESSAMLAGAVAEFLAVRSARQTGTLVGIGQTGMLIEGPSGRGKDEWVMSLCEVAGLSRLSVEQERQGDGYMCLNAGLGFAHLKEMIGCAKRQGQLVLISELNLLGSALVEGQLNALLQGEAKPGFAMIATVNPSYQGRRAMSEAQRNRCVCVSLPPYRESELLQIVAARLNTAAVGLGSRIVAYHQAVISLLDASKRCTRPTPRELLRVCDALPDPDLDQVLRNVYEPYLIMANTHRVDTAMRPIESVEHFVEFTHQLGQRLGHDPVTRIHPAEAVDQLGALHLPTRLIRIRANSPLARQAAQTVLQGVVAAAHPTASALLTHADGVAWQSICNALGINLLQRLLKHDAQAAHEFFKQLPSLPEGEEAFSLACEAKTRQEHFSYGLACELLYPGTHEAMPKDTLNAAQLASCAEVLAHATLLRAAILGVGCYQDGVVAESMVPVRAELAATLAHYHALAPLTTWQKIGKLVPSETLAAAWRHGAAGAVFVGRAVGQGASAVGHVIGKGASAVGSVIGKGATATGRFAEAHKKMLLTVTSPVWAPVAVGAGLVVGAGAVGLIGVAGGVAIVAGSMAGIIGGLEWGVTKVIPAWRLNRNLPNPKKAFVYHGHLNTLRDVDFWPRPKSCKVTAAGPSYLAEGYVSEFTKLGNVRSAPYRNVAAPMVLPESASEGQVTCEVDGEADLRYKNGHYQISLPTVGELCPTDVKLLCNGREIEGGVDVIRVEDGRFVGVLGHSRRALFGPRSRVVHGLHRRLSEKARDKAERDAARFNDSGEALTLTYELRPQQPTPPPGDYGLQPLPFRIDYSAWPELADFVDTLSPAASVRGAAALCTWLQEHALYDRGRLLALAYGWSEIDMVFNTNPVNTFLRLQRGASLQSAQAFMAIVRDKLRVPVRIASGTYHGSSRTPRDEIQIMHAWCEVYLEGQGWVTFDPTPRRHSDDWVRRREAFWDSIADVMGFYSPPPHVQVLERHGDNFEVATRLREVMPETRLRVVYQVEGDAEIAEGFANLLSQKYSDQLFVSGLKPQQRLSSSPPGNLDVARLARGEIKTFVNTDVGRAPLRKTLVVPTCDILLSASLVARPGRRYKPGVQIDESPVRASRVYWSAFFALGCEVDVVCVDGRIVSATDVDELLALADNTSTRLAVRERHHQRARQAAMRRNDAVVSWALNRQKSSTKFAKFDHEAAKLEFSTLWQAQAGNIKVPPSRSAVIKSLSQPDKSGWGGLTHVHFSGIILTHRIYQALQEMPNLQGITVGGLLTTGEIRIPYLPHLRSVHANAVDDAVSLWVNFDFVPGGVPWPVKYSGGIFGQAAHRVACDMPRAPSIAASQIVPPGGGVTPAAQQVMLDTDLGTPELPPITENV